MNHSDIKDDPLDALFGGAPSAAPAETAVVRKTPPASYKPMDFSEPCSKCRGSGAWRPGYPCFACKGRGTVTFKTSREKRAGARVRGANLKASKIEAFKAEHPDVWAWMDGSTFPPAMQMRADLEKYGTLFDSRIDFARRMIAKRDEASALAKAEQTARETAAQTVNVDALTEAFARAAKRNKRVGLWIGDVKITPAKPGSKWFGSLYVRDHAADLYLGRVTAGRFVPSREGREHEAAILAIMQDPKAAAIQHGRLTGACSVCSRTLTDPESVAAGIGPVCSEAFGW